MNRKIYTEEVRRTAEKFYDCFSGERPTEEWLESAAEGENIPEALRKEFKDAVVLGVIDLRTGCWPWR